MRSGIPDLPFEGIAYTVEDALAGDGWGVKSTSASLAPVPPLSRDLNDAAPFLDPGVNTTANAPIATASGRMHPMPILVPERAGQRHTLTLDAPVATTERRLSRRRSPVQIWSGAPQVRPDFKPPPRPEP
jgi:hypothetical protein